MHWPFGMHNAPDNVAPTMVRCKWAILSTADHKFIPRLTTAKK
ncbi:hypothetical protein Krac_6582 [Ktedonobacter racemifer DSM 44963]|uniref:Uncharacterized protein n=1 Tax=Ktedonobacter racemifer DSM 44963 TaxID=485913 RepID=D6TVG8_KTERA|nr:hypothetical protein Krac_6582 [Ktedonobacter racemifer DSM 44963]